MLNENSALKKILQASEREQDIEILQTGGGIVLKFSAAMYQMVKVATEQYFISTDQLLKCDRIPVKDKSGVHVETKYKVGRDKSHLYTLNMYYSRSSCLVNGKHVEQYLDTDLPSIVNSAQVSLHSNNVSTGEMNEYIKNQILSSIEESDKKGPIISEISKEDDENHLNIEPQALCEPVNQTPDDLTRIMEMLEKVQDTVEELHCVFHEHKRDTERKLDTLRDEIHSVKKQISCTNTITENKLEEVQDTATLMKQKIDKHNETLIRRLQSITDAVKQITQKKNSQSDNRNLNLTSHDHKKADGNLRRDRTLIIGDSILKGINQNGLADYVDMQRCPGAGVTDVLTRLDDLDAPFQRYANAVLYIGGNDVSRGIHHETFSEDLRRLILKLQNNQVLVFICNICPRRDADVTFYNKTISRICKETGAIVVDCNLPFTYGDGTPVHSYFQKDGIHLSVNGSKTLVRCINERHNIVKKRDTVEGHRASNLRQRHENRNFQSTPKLASQYTRKKRTWHEGPYGTSRYSTRHFHTHGHSDERDFHQQSHRSGNDANGHLMSPCRSHRPQQSYNRYSEDASSHINQWAGTLNSRCVNCDSDNHSDMNCPYTQ